ncbi:MAG: transcription antitermination factor NusB [Actinomycetota bacterium]
MSGSAPASSRSRREARERAIELAYEAETRSIGVAELLADLAITPDPFTVALLRAAEEHRVEAEALISELSSGWPLARMPTIDRLVMRMAVAEMMTMETPRGVVLSEAVELASRYSTDESGRFVNGVLAAASRSLPAPG